LFVREVMTGDPNSLKSNDLVSKARSVIRSKRLRAMPVIDDDKLVGIVSRGDVLKVTSTKSNLTVSGIMSGNPATCRSDIDLREAAGSMIQRSVRQLVVVGEDGDVVGLVTMRDVLRGYLSENVSPRRLTIGDIASQKVVTCSPDDNLSRVWSRMIETGYSGLPVVEKNRVVGMITRMNLIRRGTRLKIETGKTGGTVVRRIMSPALITVSSSESVLEAAKKIKDNKINRLPVIDERGRLEGIVDLEDLLQAFT